ncbi:rhodanese-related sulfurtransferase [Hymenobacter sp. BT770]|uniref:oxygen-dependent tRNA uridine(34) hydroxylase TrhO n=1 Tax=Hymenobacter sp. BT770 TaxID=2886942 RepID=UPI001D108482|nr:rhodanese-related sulfurtransferase [Hymenobacter sp. BT770]MCC3152417.1 rhodanese-related sulfurtransferase [Hymenobacter sp. BT770]MDO3414607.1 rhodanese-related sulfurtransferase [Hymenobacter sp. BT770]
MSFQVLLYYCYTPLDNPEQFREEHHRMCLELDLRGRIIVAAEGLNGTVSGTVESCARYMTAVKADPRFAALEFKIDEVLAHTFQKLHVRVKPEIVHSSLRHVRPHEKTGQHLSPEEFKALKDRDDVVVVDVRSDYEYNLGRFKNAVTLDMENFRDFPERVERLKEFKDKKILTYCTGGVKCEKASAFLLEQGFENVYQLHGGIIKYGIEAGGEDFDGQCYVFDNRVAVDVNRVNPTVISRCQHCQQPSNRLVNCANPHCNAHLPLCEACGEQLQGACSEACAAHPDKRPYDGTGAYPKLSNHYNPAQGLASYKA